MFRFATAAVLAVLAFAPFAPAADKAEKPKKPAGAWTRVVNDVTVTINFEDDALHCEMARADGVCIKINASYGVTPDGVAYGIVTRSEKKGTDEGPDKGILFSFTYQADKDTLTLRDLNASVDVSDEGRKLLEGEYKAKK
jgi:hypothetical protein